MKTSELEKYLFDCIPISQSLGIKVIEVESNHVSISAPIQPNRNHLNTVFGGSSSTVCILTAWSLFQNYIFNNQLDGKVMIRKQMVDYLKPITKNFVCNAYFNDDLDLAVFQNTFNKMHKARLAITEHIYQEAQLAVEFKGIFVLMKV